MRFVFFVIGAALGIFGAYWLADQTMAELVVRCENLILYGLGVAFLISLTFFPMMLIREAVFEESPIGWLLSVLVPILYYGVVSIALMWVISLVPFISQGMCVDCRIPADVKAQIDEDETDRDTVNSQLKDIRKFNSELRKELSDMSDTTQRALAEFNNKKDCLLKGEIQEIRALYLQSGFAYDDLDAIDAINDATRTTCEQTAQDANMLLDDMQKVVDGLADGDEKKNWSDKIRDRRESVKLLAEKCKPEIMMKSLATVANGDDLIIDVQLFSEVDGKDVPKEQMAGVLQVIAADTKVEDVQITESSKDDKACLLLVMDSSGSIPKESMPNIVSAVDKLNETRKRGDLYGIVTFGGPDEIVNHGLQQDVINTQVLNRNGGYTAIWDAMNVGLDEMAANCDQSIAKRYLVLMTDGVDNSSKFMQGSEKIEIATALHERAVSMSTNVCVVGVSADVADEAVNLQKLVNNCGYQQIDDFDSLADQFRQIMGYERAYYRITVPRTALPADLQSVTVRIVGSRVKIDIDVAGVLQK
jgi:hypothetical protein